MASIDTLPIETLLPIFLLCNTAEYQNLALCSRRLLLIATSEECLCERFLVYHRTQIYCDPHELEYLLKNSKEQDNVHILRSLEGLLKWEWLNKASALAVGWDSKTMAAVVGFIWFQFAIFAQYNINNSLYPFHHNASLTAQSAPTDPVDLKNALLVDVFNYGFIDTHVIWANLRAIRSSSRTARREYHIPKSSMMKLTNEHACNIRLAMAKLLLKGCENRRGQLRLWGPATTEHRSVSSSSTIPSSGGLPRTLLCLETFKDIDEGLHHTNLTIANEHLIILYIHTHPHMFGLAEAVTVQGKYLQGVCLFRNPDQLVNVRQMRMWGEFDEKAEYEVAGVAWDDPMSQKSAEYFDRCWRQLKWDLFSSQDYNAEEVFFWGWSVPERPEAEAEADAEIDAEIETVSIPPFTYHFLDIGVGI